MHIPVVWWWLVPASLALGICVGFLVYLLVCQRQSLDAELTGAISRGELQVLYQPIFDLDSRNCVGAEALLRWRRPDGTLTSPDLFIPMAENTGQIRQMTDFVLQRLLEQLGQLLRANPQLYISVNLAACDVTVPRIGQVMARLLTCTASLRGKLPLRSPSAGWSMWWWPGKTCNRCEMSGTRY